MATKKNQAKTAAEAVEATEAVEAAAEDAKSVPGDTVNARVLIKFRDKETGSILEPGVGIVLTRARFDEISSAGEYLEEIL